MKIGVPKERKIGECRVAITPSGAAQLAAAGHKIIIEIDAGINSGFNNDEYLDAGAQITESLADVWRSCELLLKVKEPAPEEYSYFRKDLAIFCFLHPAAAEDLTRELLKSGVLSFDYDLLMLDDGSLPVLHPMSVIAGKLSVQCGARGLQSDNGGRGVLLGGCEGVSPAKVVVLGAGSAGSSAAAVAVGMGAEVVVFDLVEEKLKHLEQCCRGSSGSVRGVVSGPGLLENELNNADLVIGAVLVAGQRAPKLITRVMLTKMNEGSVLVDISIDQGGCSESSRVQTLENPYYRESGVLHYAVPNMPALVPRTSTLALTAASLPWVDKICSLGPEQAAVKVPELRRSLVTRGGKLCNKIVGEALGIACEES